MNMFSVRLKALRQAAKETQEDIARLLHVRRTTVGEYERGNICPPMSKLQILADHYCVSVDYLIGKTNLQTPEEQNEEAPKDLFRIIGSLIDALEDDKHNIIFKGQPIKRDLRTILVRNLQNDIDILEIISNL